jgi:hypothetical protein
MSPPPKPLPLGRGRLAPELSLLRTALSSAAILDAFSWALEGSIRRPSAPYLDLGGGLNELARLVPRGRLLAQLLHGLSRLADLVVGRGVVHPVAAVPGSVGPAIGVVVISHCEN